MGASGLMNFMQHSHGHASKDVLTLVVSFCALGLSIQGYFQRRAENAISLRKQLTEMLEKITDLNTEVAKFRSLKDKEGYPANYPGVLNDQRRFFARQAAYLAARIETMTSPYEYLLIAAALNDVEAVDQAEEYFKKALGMKNTPMEDARIARAYAQFLFSQGRAEEGRNQFSKLEAKMHGLSDVEIAFRANTYERWASAEYDFMRTDQALALLRQAAEIYAKFHHPVRREREVARVEALIELRREEIRTGPAPGPTNASTPIKAQAEDFA